MKKSIFIACLGLFNLGIAQAPANYYNGTDGLTGFTLKSKLNTLISNGAQDLGYGSGTGGLWTTYATSDVDKYYENNGTLLDMYSEIPGGADAYEYKIGQVSAGGNQCGNGVSHENSCYNREHSLPKTYFGGITATPMANDAHFVIPTDYYVNSRRSDFPYGETTSPSWTSTNGTKLGSCTAPGYSGTILEPINEFKGDIARMQLYFITRYQDKLSSFTQYQTASSPLDGSTDKGYKVWYLNLMLKWSAQDPVSQKEIDRNNAIYNRQKNRNPFIDHPEWVTAIWGAAPMAVHDADFTQKYKVYPNPTKSGASISVEGNDLKKYTKAWIYNLVGQRVQEIIEPFKNGNTIQLNNLPKGIYILKTDDLNTKFIVE